MKTYWRQLMANIQWYNGYVILTIDMILQNDKYRSYDYILLTNVCMHAANICTATHEDNKYVPRDLFNYYTLFLLVFHYNLLQKSNIFLSDSRAPVHHSTSRHCIKIL